MEGQFYSGEQDTSANKRKIEIIILTVFVAVIISVAYFLFRSSQNKQTPTRNQAGTSGSTYTPPSQTSNGPAGTAVGTTKQKETSPLINPVEKKNIDKKINPQQQETPPEYNFDYELSPELNQGGGAFLFLKRILAEDRCDLASTPKKVTVYQLEREYPVEIASKMAETCGIKSEPAAQPISGTIQYLFSNPAVTGDYFTLLQSSGSNLCHHALKTVGDDIGESAAYSKALSELKRIGFASDELYGLAKARQSGSNHYIFRFGKLWHELSVLDQNSLTELGSKSVCSVDPSETMNTVEVAIAQDGALANLTNKVRKAPQTFEYTTLSLKDALKESEGTPIVPPEVFSPKRTTSGKVTITESTKPVYFDLGEPYGQVCYVPVYLTSGTTSTGAKVVSMFATVSQQNLKDSCITKALASSETLPTIVAKQSKEPGTVQYGTFEFPTPTIAAPPGGTGQCWGNQVDWTFTCYQGSTNKGTASCSAFVPVKPNADPYNTCFTGCFNPPVKKTYKASERKGSDPCLQFLQDVTTEKCGDLKDDASKADCLNLPNTYQGSGTSSSGGKGTFSIPAGDVTCEFNSCPC